MGIKKPHVRRYALLFLVVANVLVWYAIALETPDGVMHVSFLDVGQGDAIFVELDGNQVLIDGGSANQKVLHELSDVMPFYDRSIDLVVATHPDEDHIGGLVDVLRRFRVGFVVDSGYVRDTRGYLLKEELIQKEGIPRARGRRGMRILVGKGAYMDILFPDRPIASGDPNAASLIMKLTYGEMDFLLTGDAPRSIERYTAALDGEYLRSEVLKAGHHGSKTSTDTALLGVSKPDYVVIQAGAGNRYGHPHEEVLALLGEHDITVLRTDELGTITFSTDGRTLSIE